MKSLKYKILERKINECTFSFEELLEDMEDYFSEIFYEDGLKEEANVYWNEDYDDIYHQQTNMYLKRYLIKFKKY